MLTIVFNQPGPAVTRFTGTYVAAKPAKLVPPRQRIGLRGSMARMACGVSTLTLGPPPVGIYADEAEDEEIAVLLFAMG